MSRPEGSTATGEASGTAGGVTIEQLYAEVTGSDGGVRLAPDQQAEAVFNRVSESLFDGEFRFDESTVKSNLDEVLLLLVAGRHADRHGKALMGDLTTVFDTHMSPGTVYPRLHDLEDEGPLEVQELVRTKEYRIDDEAAIEEQVEESMRQHLAMGLFMRAALAELF